MSTNADGGARPPRDDERTTRRGLEGSTGVAEGAGGGGREEQQEEEWKGREGERGRGAVAGGYAAATFYDRDGSLHTKLAPTPTERELRAELENRGLDSTGDMAVLQQRLLTAVVGAARQNASGDDGVARGRKRTRQHAESEGGSGGAAAAESCISSEALLKKLECPICMETIPPPINQCTAGHTLCSECKDKLPHPRRCPECRVKLSVGRNLVLEQLVAELPIPCSFASGGCTETVKYGELREHRNACEFRPLKCPSVNCDFRGSYSQIIKHLRKSPGCAVYNYVQVTPNYDDGRLCSEYMGGSSCGDMWDEGEQEELTLGEGDG
eukprot:COSAG03_NODE_6799_length_1004_cov_1.124862_1_plen_325_part_10